MDSPQLASAEIQQQLHQPIEAYKGLTPSPFLRALEESFISISQQNMDTILVYLHIFFNTKLCIKIRFPTTIGILILLLKQKAHLKFFFLFFLINRKLM